MIAVCGIGNRSGCRNNAVTANQSARPPTIDASAAAPTYPHAPLSSKTQRHTAYTPAATTSSPPAMSFIRRSPATLAWSGSRNVGVVMRRRGTQRVRRSTARRPRRPGGRRRSPAAMACGGSYDEGTRRPPATRSARFTIVCVFDDRRRRTVTDPDQPQQPWQQSAPWQPPQQPPSQPTTPYPPVPEQPQQPGQGYPPPPAYPPQQPYPQQPYPPQQYPPQQAYPSQQQAWGGPPAPGWVATPAKRSRRTLYLALAAVVLLAAGLITWKLWPSDDAPQITWHGKDIAGAGDVLKSAESTVKAQVSSRHGVSAG